MIHSPSDIVTESAIFPIPFVGSRNYFTVVLLTPRLICTCENCPLLAVPNLLYILVKMTPICKNRGRDTFNAGQVASTVPPI